MSFSKNYQDIIQQIEKIDPVKYGKTRNFIDGAVTRLSPYISRGVISTRMLMQHVLKQGYPFYKIEKFIQELAWRDYWQQIWIAKGDLINTDLKHRQTGVENHEMPESILDANTGIEAIDTAITQFYEDGYLHNHVRMYIASMTCNVGRSHWKTPARWMYYHLLDGDWASNALSWQWVAGANSNKKYFANQENINKYCHTRQSGTYLDVHYTQFENIKTPVELQKTTIPDLITPLPEKQPIKMDPSKPTLIYNYYNLDPNWKVGESMNRVLLLEPSVFEVYPISKNALGFMLDLAKNIDGIQVYVGEFDELKKETEIQDVTFKEHPLNHNYKGNEEPRDWMFSVKGYYPSFFAFWKKCKKELR
jgi:deoxyribodipyrimidine photo-lyase